MDMEQLILDELHLVSAKVDALGEKVATANAAIVERVVALEVTSEDISGNGQPGRMRDAEEDIKTLKRERYWIVGWASGIAAIFAVVVEMIRLKVLH